jgi:hypothetical protein
LIEIGSERTYSSITRRVASTLGSIATLLIIVWIARGILVLSAYSAELLTISFGLVFLGRALRTRTSQGTLRAASSFLRNIAAGCIVVLVAILILGWVAGIQADTLPRTITQQVPALVIIAIATGLASYATLELSPRVRGPVARGPPIVVSPASGLNFGEVKLATRKDSMALPIRGSGRTLGAMLFGDITAIFETPMGPVTGSIPGPVTTLGIPFRGQKADNDAVTKLTGKSLSELLDETEVDTSLPRGEIFRGGFDGNAFTEERIDLPFVHIRTTSSGESVKVGPIRVTTGSAGEEDVEVGPFTFNPCDWDESKSSRAWFRERGPCDSLMQGGKRRVSSRWLAKGSHGNSYLSASPEGAQARWNGSSLRIKGDSMKMAVGSDGFVYSPTELETYSPLHTLSVTPSKATLNTKNFALNVSGNRVILRAEDGSRSTESPALAKDLLQLLTETANKQVKDVIEGQPMELDDMLVRTEEVLKKYD